LRQQVLNIKRRKRNCNQNN